MATKKKRDLFEEIKQGIKDFKAHKAGKITLRTHEIKPQPKIKIMTAEKTIKNK